MTNKTWVALPKSGKGKQFNLGMGHWPKTWREEEEAAVFLIFVHSQIHHLECTAGIEAEYNKFCPNHIEQ